MSETTRRDPDALREGLLLVEEWRKTHEGWARMAGADANAEMERRKACAYAAVAAVVRRELEAPATGEDVRERVAREIREAAWADPTGLRERQNAEALADRILALLHTPRGEGSISDPRALEVLDDDTLLAVAQYADDLLHRRGLPCVECHRAGSTPRGEGEAWRAFLDALDEFEAAANLWADPEGPTAADMERLRQSRQRVIECARALAALRSEAQGEARPRTSWDWMDYLECLLEDHVVAHDPATCCDVDDDEACCTTCALYRLHQRKPWRAAHPTDRSESDGE